MTYKVFYKDKVMFDIEYFLSKSKDNTKWFSEIDCLPCVGGLSYFLKDKLSDSNFNFEKFVEDTNEIQEIRGLLYEKYDNMPKQIEEARRFHYHVFRPILDRILKSFCERFDLSFITD